MGLFDIFKKRKQVEPATKDKFHNSLGEDLRHLTADGELPFGWMVYNTDVVNQMESEVSVLRSNIHEAKDTRQLRAALQSYMLYLEDGKKHYYKIGECEGKYFEEYIIGSEETRGNRERLERLELEKA